MTSDALSIALLEVTKTNWDWWLKYGFDGLVGGVVGGAVTGLAVFFTIRHERKTASEGIEAGKDLARELIAHEREIAREAIEHERRLAEEAVVATSVTDFLRQTSRLQLQCVAYQPADHQEWVGALSEIFSASALVESVTFRRHPVFADDINTLTIQIASVGSTVDEDGKLLIEKEAVLSRITDMTVRASTLLKVVDAYEKATPRVPPLDK